MDKTDTACSCHKCANLCKGMPGWMTPAEARKLISAGLGSSLMLDYSAAEEAGEVDIHVLCPAIKGYESGPAPDTLTLLLGIHGGCTFFESGLCNIHFSGFKPIQCQTAFGCEQKSGVKWVNKPDIKDLWNTQVGLSLVEEWKRLMAEHRGEVS